MTPDEIRDGLRNAAVRREQADRDKAEATEDLRRWLREAEPTNISHAEAARLAGLSRNGAYQLLRR